MAILPLGAVATPFVPNTSISGIAGISGTPAPSTGGGGFADMLTKGIDNVTALQDNASVLSGQVATGQLQDVSEFTTAAAKASLGVSLTAAVRNKAVEAYQEIMRMQV